LSCQISAQHEVAQNWRQKQGSTMSVPELFMKSNSGPAESRLVYRKIFASEIFDGFLNGSG